METIDTKRKAEDVMDRTRRLMETRKVTVTLTVAEMEALLFAACSARRILRAGADGNLQAALEARRLEATFMEDGLYHPSDLFDAGDAVADAVEGALGFIECLVDAGGEEVGS